MEVEVEVDVLEVSDINFDSVTYGILSLNNSFLNLVVTIEYLNSVFQLGPVLVLELVVR